MNDETSITAIAPTNFDQLLNLLAACLQGVNSQVELVHSP
jgi:hypothetical protein